MTTTEDLLRAALRSRAETTTHVPTPGATVAARARAHQRRTRAAASLAAVAAAVAVAVPAGLLAGVGPLDRSDVPAPADSPTLELPGLADLPQGGAPAVDYVRDQTYVFADGRTLDLPGDGGSLLDAAPYLGGVLAVTADPAGAPPRLSLVDPDGSVRWTRCGSDVVVSSDGDVTGFGWLGGGCDEGWERPRLEWGPARAEGGVRGGQLEAAEAVRVVAVDEDGVVLDVTGAPGEPSRVDVAPWRSEIATVPGLAYATDADLAAGLVAGCTANDGCGVYDESGTTVLGFEDSAESPVAFSPDGTLVATATVGDAPTLRVREVADGDVLLTVETGEGFRGDLAWEDEEHLLLARVDRSGEALVRLGLDGSVERATDVAAPTLGGYLLPTA